MIFDTKIALVVRNDLELWQKLNVTAFLTSGVIGNTQNIMGESYEDASNVQYHPLAIQPMIILSASAAELARTRRRAADRSMPVAIYIEDMFATGHDAANRETVRQYPSEELPLVGLAMRGDKKIVDKITKGLKLHG